MHTTSIVLFSNEGKVADAIIDLLSNHFNVQKCVLNESDLLKTELPESDLIRNSTVIVLNLSETINDGELLLSHLRATYIDVPIVVLHLYHQKTFAKAFLKMGANAYLPVNFLTEDLLSAIEHAISNKPFVGRNVY